jgi:hypothetical protein
MAVVLKTSTSRSFGKAASPSGAAASLASNLRDQLSVIFGVVVIKCCSTPAFVGELRYNALLRA